MLEQLLPFIPIDKVYSFLIPVYINTTEEVVVKVTDFGL